MQKSEQDGVFELFGNAIALTNRIFEHFQEKDSKCFDIIADLYKERGKILETIDVWRADHAEEFRDSAFADRWLATAEELRLKDQAIVNRYPQILETVQEKLRDITKRKYLLIYSRESGL